MKRILYIFGSVWLAEAILVAHVQKRGVVQGVPELVNEIIRQQFLASRVIREPRNKLNCSFHEHRLIILLSFALQFSSDNGCDCLQV